MGDRRPRALALVSGGLDSLLAGRVVMDQGVEVNGVAFIMQFAARDLEGFVDKLQQAAAEAKIPTRTVDISEEFLGLIRAPDHGFGANMNPCIDCKILMLRTAKEIALREGFDMIVTGEVLGERPMSQRRAALDIIKKRSLTGELLLRPLSAKLLEPSAPEQKGLVDRDKLLAIKGRSRKKQLELARHYGLSRYFSPAGGCLLTEKKFSDKLADLKKHDALDSEQVGLLKNGRHFRLDDRTKVVVGRNKADNERIRASSAGMTTFVLEGGPGPVGLLVGENTDENIRAAAALVVSHSKMRSDPGVPVVYSEGSVEKGRVCVSALREKDMAAMRV